MKIYLPLPERRRVQIDTNDVIAVVETYPYGSGFELFLRGGSGSFVLTSQAAANLEAAGLVTRP